MTTVRQVLAGVQRDFDFTSSADDDVNMLNMLNMVVVMNLWWGDRRRWFDFTLLHSLLHKDHDYRFWRGRRKFSSHICSFLCFTKFHVIHTACAVEWWRMIYSVFDGEPAILWSAENFPYSTLHYCGVWLYVSVWQLLSIKENICAESPRKSYALQDANK